MGEFEPVSSPENQVEYGEAGDAEKPPYKGDKKAKPGDLERELAELAKSKGDRRTADELSLDARAIDSRVRRNERAKELGLVDEES